MLFRSPPVEDSFSANVRNGFAIAGNGEQRAFNPIQWREPFENADWVIVRVCDGDVYQDTALPTKRKNICRPSRPLLLVAGAMRAAWSPLVTVAGERVLLFDLGGVLATVGLVVVFVAASIRNGLELYRAEPMPPRLQAEEAA